MAGDLDPTFAGGRTTFALHPGTNLALSVALQPDGKAVVGAVTTLEDGRRTVALARYRTDGTLDPTFGGDGLVDDTGPVEAGSSFRAFLGAYDVAVAPDGRILAAAPLTAAASDGTSAWSVARFTADGSRDPSFDGDGWVTTAFSQGCESHAAGVAIDSLGRVVVAGIGGCNDRFVVGRYLPDGRPDPSFGTGGFVDVGQGGALEVMIDAHGRVVAGGVLGTLDVDHDSALVRLDPVDGSIDESFGDGGVVRTDFGGNDLVVDLAGDVDGGGITAAVTDAGGRLRVARYGVDGAPDGSFSGGSVVVSGIGTFGSVAGLGLQPDGHVVVSGVVDAEDGAGDLGDFGVARLRPDGTPDAAWGGDGVVSTDFGGAPDFATELAVRPNGDLLVVGASSGPTDSRAAVAAYRGEVCGGILLDGAVVVGTGTGDELTGTAANDLLLGLGGNDDIAGGGGSDCVIAGAGDDTVYGGTGDDLLLGRAGADAVEGGRGDDVIVVDAGDVPSRSTETIGGGPHVAGDSLELRSGLAPSGAGGRRSSSVVTDPITGGTFRISGIEQTRDT